MSKSLKKFCPFTITPFPKNITVGKTSPITKESAPNKVLNEDDMWPKHQKQNMHRIVSGSL